MFPAPSRDVLRPQTPLGARATLPSAAVAPVAPATDGKYGPGISQAAPDATPLRADNTLPFELPTPAVPLSLIATTTAATGAAATHSTSAAAPLEQIAPTLLAMAKTPAGNQEMTIRLQPAELGMVQVRIERALSGSTLVEITAEKSETLQAFQQDQPQLHRMLDEAGIPAAGRSVTFHAAQPPSESNGSGQSSGQSGSQHASSGRTSDGNPQDSGAAGGGKGEYPAREANPWSGGRRQSISSASAGTDTTTGRSYRVGLDITA